MTLVMRIEPEHLACAFHRVQQKRRNSSQGYENAFLKHTSIKFDEVLPPLRCISHYESFGGTQSPQSLTPEDVRTGYEVGELVKRTVRTYDANPMEGRDVTKDVYEPWGRVLAVFHHYGRREPILYALGSVKSKGGSDGKSKGVSSGENVRARPASVPLGCRPGCGTEQTAAGLVWLLRRLYGAHGSLTVRPAAVEEAADVAQAWCLIQRDGSTDWGMSITDAGRIWLLAHCREHGEELDPTAAERRSIQNIIDARGASGMNINQGNTNQGNVNFGSQGDVIQGTHGPVSAGSAADLSALSQALNLIVGRQQQLRLSPEQFAELEQAMKQMRDSIDSRDPYTPAAARAGQTILALARDVLVKAGAGVTLDVLQKIIGVS